MIYKGTTHGISIRRSKQNAKKREPAEESSELGKD
jgi:hypothetical protein